jgi:thiamine-phosphate pyrophosphorylase
MAAAEFIPQQLLRIADANLNRASEGLRVLEDIARLALDDAALSQKLKIMRHELLPGEVTFNEQLIKARDAEHDVGINTLAPGQEEKKELPQMVIANARRVQQSLRTIEELGRTPLPAQLASDRLRQTRFELYSVEKELLSRLQRQDKKERIRGLCAIIDTEALAGRDHVAVAHQVIRGGAAIIQLRDKQHGKKELLAIAQELKSLCAEYSVLFIINDYLDLALAVDADGLHLGQDDLPLPVARKLLPIGKILGCSTHSLEQAKAAQATGADYIAIGSIYPTPSKESAIIIGTETLQQVRQAVSLPVMAIGGITRENVGEVTRAGADSVAVISAILSAKSPEAATREIVSRMVTQDE